MLVPLIPKGFIDNGDLGLSTVSVELPPGSTLENTKEVVEQTSRLIQGSPAVDNVLATSGSSGSSNSSGVNKATVFVRLKPKEERKLSQAEFEQQLRPQLSKIPGARISFQGQGSGGSIVLKSENPEALTQAANDLEKQMRTVPGLVEVTSSASLVKPEILVVPDPARAGDLGVTVQAIARTASLATIGDIDSNLAKFNLPDRQIPIRIQIDPKARQDIDTLKNLKVPGRNNTLVPLTAVADIRLGSGPAQIDRYNRSRQISVEGNLQGISLGDAVAVVRKLPALNPLPPGVVEQASGDAKIMGEVFSRFGGALALAVMCISGILVLLYNNFLHPVTIMAALPFSIGGALLGLMIAQKALGLYALIGIVLLMGIVTKNSILLVDYTLINLEEGKSQYQAVLEAGLSRLRPILMTSLATIIGILPLAMGVGAGAEVRSPMGVTVMGGFTTSTLLTLLVVPVVFTYVDNLQHWIVNLGRHGLGRKSDRTKVAAVPMSSEEQAARLLRSSSEGENGNSNKN